MLVGALIVNLLAIHPVADGNGRLARLLTTYELLAAGYGVARYVSVEQRIYEAKNTYYQTLYESQLGWHTGEHTIWPWTTFLIRILDDAYQISSSASPRLPPTPARSRTVFASTSWGTPPRSSAHAISIVPSLV